MYVPFVLLSLLVWSTYAFNLTYPIKGTYVGYQGTNWGDPGSVITNTADAGYNLIILNFYGNTSYEMLQAWDGVPASKQKTYMAYAHNKSAAILLGVWVQALYGDLGNKNATELGITLANQVKQRNLDGVDINIRELNQTDINGFGIGAKNNTDSIAWVVQLTVTLRQNLGPQAVITYSVLPKSFGPVNGTISGGPGPLGGFTTIHPQISNLIQHYHLAYYNNGPLCYIDYNTLFVQSTASCTMSTSVQEISTNANISLQRLVISKPIEPTMALAGYLPVSDIKMALSTGQAYLGWNAGVMAWTWDISVPYGIANSTKWISNIYPLLRITPTAPPPTALPTLPPTSKPTLAPTPPPSGGDISSDSSSDGLPIKTECGLNELKESNGKCACKSGYYRSGKSCKKSAVLVVAIIIPITIVAIIVVILFFFLRSRRERRALRSVRLNTEKSVVILPELESTNLITDFESIVIKTRLGQGGSGVVNMGVWRHIDVAVKQFNNQDIQTTDFVRESDIHAKLRHPNVVQLLAICLPPHMCTVSEFMAKGSLADVLQEKSTGFTWKRKLVALRDIAKGMDYLHKSKIIHRDLKSQNCLIDKNWNCKIADFGTSKLVGEKNQTATAYVPRTAQWSAPEVIVRGEYSEQSDVFSYGVILWECLTGEIPYDGMFAFQVEDRTVKGLRLEIPAGCEPWLESLMKQCWSEDPLSRPSFESIISIVEKVISEKK